MVLHGPVHGAKDRSGVLVGPGTKRKLRPGIPTSRRKKEGDGARACRPPPNSTTEQVASPCIFIRSPIYTTLCFFSQASESPLTQPAPPLETGRLLAELYRVATAAVDPGPALRRRLEAAGRPARPPRVLALGKAALPMARAAVETLAAWGLEPSGGVVVAPATGAPPHPRLPVAVGDHPEPGAGSLAAAVAVATATEGLGEGDEVWVLLSGGTTSLIGAPEPGLTPADLTAIYGHLLGSGLDIAAMNRIRKRFARWGGGKLGPRARPGHGPGVRRLRRDRRRSRRDRLRALRSRPGHRR